MARPTGTLERKPLHRPVESAAVMLLAPGLVPLANEFLVRNLGLTAHIFGDEATTKIMTDTVKSIQERDAD